MKITSKRLLATLATGAMVASTAAPVSAQDRWRDRDRDEGGISAGEVIAGAVVLGGLAAILSSANRDRDRYDYRDRRWGDRHHHRDRRWSRRDDPRLAVERCVRAAEQDARRVGYRYADVTEIRDVDRTRRGYRVEGRLRVEDTRRGYGRYDRWGGWDRDRRGFSDAGRFSCRVEYGRIRDMDYRSIRGLG